VVEHPEVKIVCADGSTSDDPRYANIGCFNHPYLMDVSKKMIKEFLEAFKDHSSLYRIDGLPLLSFIHEAYYRTDIPEFGGSPLKPCCYCGYCVEDFRKKMKEKYGDVEEFNERHGTDFSSWEDLEPPRSDVNPSLWKEWLDYHSDIIPNFLEELIEYAKSITPVLSTHELNDFYPCTYQCVYSGNDIWRMARVIDIGHEDMYPLEFDHRYVIYVYEYIKDAVRTAMGFEKIYTGNGQSFNSWLGYKIPPASMSEQVYSTLAHGALGLVWWVDWGDLGLWAQTAKPNAEFARLISALKDYELTRAEVALVYPWTTMQLRTDDAYSMDNLLFYMALVRSGYPVDVISEDQILGGLLEERGYKILCTVGSSVFPPDVAEKIREFVRKGGVLIADYEKGGIGEFTPVYPELMGKSPTKHVIYEIDTDDPSLRAMNGTTIPIGNLCEQLRTPETGKTVARFENGEPAVIMVQEGSGRIIKAGSFLGWDYSNYPGHYDFAVMFPFLIRRNEDVREMISRIIKGSGVQPPAESENPDVEVAFWRSRGRSLVLAINHLNEPSETAIQVRVDTSSSHRVREFFTGEEISSGTRGNRLIFRSSHSNFEGKAYIIEET
jgi:beta-galactosidase GanA